MPLHDLRSFRPALCVLIALGCFTCSCVNEYDFTHTPRQTGSLGEEAHAILLKDAKRAKESAPAKTALLESRRDAFVVALDTIAPPSELGDLDLFLRQSLPMIDDQSLPHLTSRLSIALESARQDGPLLDALGELDGSGRIQGFISPNNPPDLIGYMVAYPKLRELGLRGAKLVLENDGFKDSGAPDVEEPAGISELVRVASDELAKVDQTALEDSIALLVRDLLIRQDDRYDRDGGRLPLYVATFDRRGVPKLRAQVLERFADDDGDGLPDLDALGDLVLKDGSSIPRLAFSKQGGSGITRDALGRAAFVGDGEPVYEYVDLNRTGLGYLLRTYPSLSEKDVLIDLFDASSVLLGPKEVLEDERGKYQGFSTENPLIDLTYATLHAVAFPGLPGMLETMAQLVRLGPAELASVVVGLERALGAFDDHPEVEIKDNQVVLYDLLPLLQEIAQDKGLWGDMIDALADPMTPHLGDAMVTLASYSNTLADPKLGGVYDTCFQQCKVAHTIGTPQRFDCIRACPNTEIFQKPFDPKAPETIRDQSQLEALWYMIWVLDGVPYQMEVETLTINGKPGPAPSPMIRFENASAAYLRALAGNMVLEDHIPRAFFEDDDIGKLLRFLGISASNVVTAIGGISTLFLEVEYNGRPLKLEAKPSPDEMTRILTRKDLVWKSDDGKYVLDVKEPLTKDGHLWVEHTSDTLFKMEAAGMVDAIYPLAKAFSDRNKEALLVSVFSVMHRHWAGSKEVYKKKNGLLSDINPANLRSLEPLLIDVLTEGSLLKGLNLLTVRMKNLKDSGALDVSEALRAMILHATLPDPALVTTKGESFINLADGRTVRNLTPLHLVLRAAGDMLGRLEANPQARDRLLTAGGHLFDVALGAQWPEGQPRGAFDDDAAVALSEHALSFLADRAARRGPSLTTWLTGEFYQDVVDLWSSRLLAGLVRIANQLLENPENRAVFDDVTRYLTSTPQGQRHTSLAAYQMLVRSMDTTTWVPMAKFAGRLIDPDRDWGGKDDPKATLPILSHGALVMQQALKNDQADMGARLIRRALTKQAVDRPTPAGELGDLLADYWRQDPAQAAEPYQRGDYEAFLQKLGDWMKDDRHGLERVYDLVDLRVK